MRDPHCGDFEELDLLPCCLAEVYRCFGAIYSKSLPVFWADLFHPSAGSKNKQSQQAASSKEQAKCCSLTHAACCLYFNLYEGRIFLQNDSKLILNYRASHSRRQCFLCCSYLIYFNF